MAENKLTFRQRVLSRPLLAWVRSTLPTMSDTEREALEAGTVWWESEILSGNPDWQRLLDLPEYRLSPEEQDFLDGPVEELCTMIDDWEICAEQRQIPDRIWDFIKTNGFLGMIIPKAYGGLGFSASAHSAVVMKLAARGASAAVSVIVPNSLGPGELLLHYGTEEQKAHYLPRLADGREIPAFALTSVDAGSDAAAMRDEGIVCEGLWRGETTLGVRLNWSKRYISLGPICTVLGLAFKLRDPDGLLGGDVERGITVALVPTDLPGVEIGRRHYPAMQVFPNGPNEGNGVFIPLAQIIGGEERIGQGWRMLVSALAAGRGISLPSLSVAGMKACTRATGAYARIREQFNVPIGRFEGVQEALARIAGHTYRIDAARRVTIAALDEGEKPAVLSGILKYHATEALRHVVDDAMDVHGGKAVCDGPRNYLGNLYRAVPIGITVEGANILTRSLIIYGQGSIRCHPHILHEMMAAQDPDPIAGLKAFDAAVWAHARHISATLARAFWRSWTLSLFCGAPDDGPTRRYYKGVTHLSACLALASEAAMLTMGGALKRKEMLSARLGDVLSELYIIACVLKTWRDDGRPAADLPLVHWACQRGLHMADRRLREILDNFPARPVAWLLRFVLRPFGERYRAPADTLTVQVAELITKNGDARARLSRGLPADAPETELGRLETAFENAIAIEPLRQRLRSARVDNLETAVADNVVSRAEADELAAFDEQIRDIMAVDDFTLDELKALGNTGAGETGKKRNVA